MSAIGIYDPSFDLDLLISQELGNTDKDKKEKEEDSKPKEQNGGRFNSFLQTFVSEAAGVVNTISEVKKAKYDVQLEQYAAERSGREARLQELQVLEQGGQQINQMSNVGANNGNGSSSNGNKQSFFASNWPLVLVGGTGIIVVIGAVAYYYHKHNSQNKEK